MVLLVASNTIILLRHFMKTIYILLTKSTTICSKVVHLATKSEYTHAAISLDKNFDKLYTFSRKYKRLLLPAGFVVESAYDGIMGDSDDMNCAVYELQISNHAYKKLVRLFRHMDYHKDKYRYSILGLVFNYFNKSYERKGYYFCSQFVHHALTHSGAIEKESESSLVRPMDFRELPEVKEIFKGNIRELRSNWDNVKIETIPMAEVL